MLLKHIPDEGKCTIIWFQDFYMASQTILIRNYLTYAILVNVSYFHWLGQCTTKWFQDFYMVNQIILIWYYLTYV